jgi:hypothetical protein
MNRVIMTRASSDERQPTSYWAALAQDYTQK